MNLSEDERLALAVEQARRRTREGIGTQQERLVHCTLKYYLEPDDSCHEITVTGTRPGAPAGEGKYAGKTYLHVADIFQKDSGHIYEIQTRSFGQLREKLTDFLPDHTVTVVYPGVYEKFLCWVDPQTGEITKRRRSPRRGRFSDILPEIYAVSSYLGCPNLDFEVILLNVEEYRALDGWSADKKHGSHRMERLPLSVAGTYRLKSPQSFQDLIPADLPEHFTRDQLEKALGLQGRKGSYACTVMEKAGAIEKAGQKGRKFIYQRKDLGNVA